MSVVITDSDIIEESVESQLRRFYQKFNPEKAVDGTVELILKTWKGKEHKLFKNLAKKYDCVGFFDQKKNHRNLNTRHIPHATVDGAHSANVIAAVEIQDESSSSPTSSSGVANEASRPHSSAAAPKSTAAWDTEAVRAVLRSVEPHFKVADHPKGTLRESLTQFYKVYNRFKLDNIPKILLKIGSQKGQIYELFVNLQKMYSRVPAWSHWQWAEARFHRLQVRTKLRDLKRGQETLLAKVKASVQMGEEDRAAALRPALEQIHDDLAKQEQLLEKFTEVERLFEKDWPLEFNMHLQGGQKKAAKAKKKKSQKSKSGATNDSTPTAEASHYEILNQTKATLQSKIDIANEAGEREIVNALFASQRELQREMARLREENMVHRPPPPLFGDDISALRASHTELRFGFMYFPLSIVQRAMQRHIVNLCGGVEAIVKGKPWPSYQVVKREMHEVFGEATFEYHKKMVQNILQTKKLDQAILDEHNRSKPNSPTATGAVLEVSSDPDPASSVASENSSSVPEATAEVVSDEVDENATAAKLATLTLSESEPATPSVKLAKTTAAPAPAKKAEAPAASGTNGASAGLTIDGEFSTESKTALQKFLNSQLSFVNAAAAAAGSKPSKKIKESGNFTGKTVMALQRFLVAFRRSLCDRGEADTGPDDPLHLEVDGKFAKPTIKVLKWFLNRNWDLAKYGKGEPLDNKKKTLTRGAIKSLQTFLNNSSLFDPLSVPVEGDDDEEEDEELS